MVERVRCVAGGCSTAPDRRRSRCDCRASSNVPSRCAPPIDTVSGTVGTRGAVVRRADSGEPFDVINNVGSNLFAGGFAGDRGFLEVDEGQYDEPAEVFAWCGGAVLLKRSYLDDVGTLRRAVLRVLRGHRSVVAGSAAWLAVRLRARSARAAPPRPVVRWSGRRSSGSTPNETGCCCWPRTRQQKLAWRSGLGEVRRAVTATIRHYVLRPLTLRLPARPEVAHRWKVCVGYLRLLPAMLRDRWTTGANGVARRRSWRGRSSSGRGMTPSDAPPADCVSACTTSTGRRSAAASRSTAASPRCSRDDHEVTLLGPHVPDVDATMRRLGVDLSACGYRRVVDDAEATEASADFDVFVNGTYLSKAINRAPVGYYYVHFPGEVPTRTDHLRSRLGVAGVKALSLAPRLPQRLTEVQAAFDRRVHRVEFVPDATPAILSNSQFTASWVERLWGRPERRAVPAGAAERAAGGQGAVDPGARPLLRPVVRAQQETARTARHLQRPASRRSAARLAHGDRRWLRRREP